MQRNKSDILKAYKERQKRNALKKKIEDIVQFLLEEQLQEEVTKEFYNSTTSHEFLYDKNQDDWVDYIDQDYEIN